MLERVLAEGKIKIKGHSLQTGRSLVRRGLAVFDARQEHVLLLTAAGKREAKELGERPPDPSSLRKFPASWPRRVAAASKK